MEQSRIIQISERVINLISMKIYQSVSGDLYVEIVMRLQKVIPRMVERVYSDDFNDNQLLRATFQLMLIELAM